MPELPEVETIALRLAPLIVGKSFSQIEVLRSKSFAGQINDLLNRPVLAVQRRAKILRLQFSQEKNLLVHLKMTGQLIYVGKEGRFGGGHPTADWVADLPSKHTRIIFTFNDQSKLFFNDMRVFGWCRLMTDQQLLSEYAKYGPDIIDSQVTASYLQKKFSNRSLPIKLAIMNNQIMAGVGNIYANEALFLAKIDPRRLAKSLSLTEINTLLKCLQAVIKKSIDLGGTTFDGVYVDVAGFAGGFQKELLVYGREDESCVNCEGKIRRIKQGGRSTFFCEKCQR